MGLIPMEEMPNVLLSEETLAFSNGVATLSEKSGYRLINCYMNGITSTAGRAYIVSFYRTNVATYEVYSLGSSTLTFTGPCICIWIKA